MMIIAMTEFGKNEIINTLTKNDIKKKKFPPISVLNHSINDIFKPPNNNNKKIYEQLLGEQYVDKFIIINPNMNIIRKRLEITLESFSKFSQGKKDVLLILKTTLKQGATIDNKNSGYNIDNLVKM